MNETFVFFTFIVEKSTQSLLYNRLDEKLVFFLFCNTFCFHHILSVHSPKQTFNLGWAPVAFACCLRPHVSLMEAEFSLEEIVCSPNRNSVTRGERRHAFHSPQMRLQEPFPDSLPPCGPALKRVSGRRVGRNSSLPSNPLPSSLSF